MIRGILAAHPDDGGVAVDIDIRGGNVHIITVDDRWQSSAREVAVEYLSPKSYRLVFAGKEYVFRPDDPVRARFTLQRDIKRASSRPGWRRRPHTSAPAGVIPNGHTRWVQSSVEIQATTPPEDDPAFVPTRPAPAPARVNTAFGQVGRSSDRADASALSDVRLRPPGKQLSRARTSIGDMSSRGATRRGITRFIASLKSWVRTVRPF